MMHYVGILDGAGDVWGVRIPDLPGCNGGGPTPEAAIADAISAMREWAATVANHGEAIPAARRLVDVIRDPESGFDPNGESTVLLPLLLEDMRPVKANISLDAGTLAAIDAAANIRGLTRSAFLVTAAREKIMRG